MDNPLISELQHLIVESLALEDVQPEDIDPAMNRSLAKDSALTALMRLNLALHSKSASA